MTSMEKEEKLQRLVLFRRFSQANLSNTDNKVMEEVNREVLERYRSPNNSCEKRGLEYLN
jgi:ribosome biogenesis protein Tsr3